jgi:hypothetical protein
VVQFKDRLEAQVQMAAGHKAQDGIRRNDFGCPIAFTSDWLSFALEPTLSKDWYLALNEVDTAATGLVTVQPGDNPVIEVSFRSHLYDRYNWDKGKFVGFGPVTITDERLARLHRAGLAKEYDVVGSSQVQTYRCTLGQTCVTALGSSGGSRRRR